MGQTAYTDLITKEHSMYLHELFRQSTCLLGDNASFEEIVTAMNANSTAQANLRQVQALSVVLKKIKEKKKE